MSALPIYIYTTSTGGTAVAQKTERVQLLLSGVENAKERIKVVFLDIADQSVRQKVWDVSGKKGNYPLVFLGEKFIGDYDTLNDANEDENLPELFK